MSTILFVLWFFAPAGFANASPVFANKLKLLPLLDTPLDFHREYKGKRILGDNKTLRGLVVGVIIGVLVAFIQLYLFNNFDWAKNISLNVNYEKPFIILLGAFLGLGALIGDAFESFIKRQAGIKSGSSWFPFDQIDYILGGVLFSMPFAVLSSRQYGILIIVWFIIHIISTVVGWLIRLRDNPI